MFTQAYLLFNSNELLSIRVLPSCETPKKGAYGFSSY